MSTRISFSMGNERRVRFWKDKWCGDSPLCMPFPSLFALVDSKEVWVVDIWDSSTQRGRGGWNPCFSRPFNDWEVDMLESFLVQLHGKRVCGDVEDTVL